MKKFLAISIILIMLVTFFTGCGTTTNLVDNDDNEIAIAPMSADLDTGNFQYITGSVTSPDGAQPYATINVYSDLPFTDSTFLGSSTAGVDGNFVVLLSSSPSMVWITQVESGKRSSNYEPLYRED